MPRWLRAKRKIAAKRRRPRSTRNATGRVSGAIRLVLGSEIMLGVVMTVSLSTFGSLSQSPRRRLDVRGGRTGDRPHVVEIPIDPDPLTGPGRQRSGQRDQGRTADAHHRTAEGRPGADGGRSGAVSDRCRHHPEHRLAQRASYRLLYRDPGQFRPRSQLIGPRRHILRALGAVRQRPSGLRSLRRHAQFGR